MADGVTGFTCYDKYYKSAMAGIEDDDERGLFWNAVMSYMFDGLDISETLPPMARCCFECNRPHLDFSRKQSINGKKTKTKPNEAKRSQTEAKPKPNEAKPKPNEAKTKPNEAKPKHEHEHEHGHEHGHGHEHMFNAEVSACADDRAQIELDSMPEADDPFAEIIDHLNAVTGSSFRKSTPATRKRINARLGEGFTVDDFKRVIDNMAGAWLGDAKMSAYLRPETLFGTKFESYLQRGRAPDACFDQRMADDFDRWDSEAEEVDAAW